MPNENPTKEQTQAAAPAAEKKAFSTKKLAFVGIPVFLLQVVVLYFIAAKFLVAPAPAGQESSADPVSSGHGDANAQHIFVVKDIIINPAGTNGTRFLLLSVGFEVSSPEAQKDLESKEVQVRDALNTILSTKTLEELSNPNQRENMRMQFSARTGELLKTGKVMNVYFTKFIIQ